MKNNPTPEYVRVRFAPAPTGLMHLGNVRTALLNYVFARRYSGSFILRIEDTDPERNIDPTATGIIGMLHWLGLSFNEGPEVGGSHGPYFQSQRSASYADALEKLIKADHVYRCFCTAEELEKRRQRQIALKMPPRYDRTCLKLTPDQVTEKLAAKMPYIWRLKITQERHVNINDLAHGTITFNLADIADLPLTRSDGTFTFVFANGVDDIEMKITYVIRGEDHITNTAAQIVLYEALGAPVPTFWHLPIMCNIEGKKLSKRDFGFSLLDLQNAGYLPEAIDNYLSIIGGGTFENEIMSLDEIVNSFDINQISSTGQIKYDVEKLRWVNHRWMAKLTIEDLTQRCLPWLLKTYPEASGISHEQLQRLVSLVRTDLVTLGDCTELLKFYFVKPMATKKDLHTLIGHETLGLAQGDRNLNRVDVVCSIIENHLDLLSSPDEFLNAIRADAKTHGLGKELYWALRVMLTGLPEGLGVKELLTALGAQEARARIEAGLKD